MSLSKGNLTKIRIIEAATDLIFKKGLYSVTFAEIAKIAGLTQPGIYNHFDSMDDIFIESALYWSKEASQFIDGGIPQLGTAKEQLKSIIEKNLQYPQKNRKEDALFVGLYYFAISSKKAYGAYEEIRKAGCLRFHTLVLRGNRENCWQVKDPLAAANSIHSLLAGEVFKIIINPQEERPEKRFQRCWSSVLKLL